MPRHLERSRVPCPAASYLQPLLADRRRRAEQRSISGIGLARASATTPACIRVSRVSMRFPARKERRAPAAWGKPKARPKAAECTLAQSRDTAPTHRLRFVQTPRWAALRIDQLERARVDAAFVDTRIQKVRLRRRAFG
jgi:hypothetical protein